VKRLLGMLAVCCMVLALAGCQQKQQFGDKKEDWAKTAPPPEYRGPGQPGGPPANAMSGAAPPPAGFQHEVTQPASRSTR